MSQLIIRRNSEWANRNRSFQLYLNGRKISEINDEELLSMATPPGTYQLIAKVGCCGSKPLNFEIAENEIKRIEIRGFIFSRYFLPVALITGLAYFGCYLKYKVNSLFLGMLLMFLFGYWSFFMSIGRKYYLRFIER